MSNTINNPVTLIPYESDTLEYAAEALITEFSSSLPVLTQITILLPNIQTAPRLRELLHIKAKEAGFDALLGPQICTLESWGRSQIPGNMNIIDNHSRDLMIIEALQHHTKLFNETSPWRLSESLIALFDKLTLNQVDITDDVESFIENIKTAYNITGSAPAHLNQEALLVHTLWKAWKKQLGDEQQIDHITAYLIGLQKIIKETPEENYFYLIGYYSLSNAEIEWVKNLFDHNRARLILHGNNSEHEAHPDYPIRKLLQSLGQNIKETPSCTGYSQYMDTVFDYGQTPISERARLFSAQYPISPAQERIKIFSARNSEQEAQAVDLQVRRWIIEGKKNIGIITEDRRLARRIRALQERAGILIEDTAGWVLSTTSAAASLERWLESIEQDFACQPLLDLLKSPFLHSEENHSINLLAIYRLEQDIILHENIARGLHRYRKHLAYREKRLDWNSEYSIIIYELLDKIETAAKPLLKLHNKVKRNPAEFLTALQDSLKKLDIWDALDNDSAGNRIVQQIEKMLAASANCNLTLNWTEFRTWLGRTLEKVYFRPSTANSPVQLLNFEHGMLSSFDAVIIAAAEQEHLPGKGSVSPYFNDSVRKELGLPTWQDKLSEKFHHFRCMLESAPTVFISYRNEQDGNEIIKSPWIEAIQHFHQLAYNYDLADSVLPELIKHNKAHISFTDNSCKPVISSFPQAGIQAELIPENISAGSYQRLLDCPYQFFCADCLKLKPVEHIKEALEKSDYGQRVHRCLEAFHGDVDNLPGPISEKITDKNRAQAIELLNKISLKVFSQDLEDNFMHRGWLKKWQQVVPSYIDLQISIEEESWTVNSVEVESSHILDSGHTIKGRLDRIDTNQESASTIIDYKTGNTPKQKDIENGEAIQLAIYALLLENAKRVEYLKLGDEAKIGATLEGDQLIQLKTSVRKRLDTIIKDLETGKTLPAWGDSRVCQYCDMDGLCRKQSWITEPG